MSRHGVDDFIAQASRRLRFRHAYELRDIHGSAFGDDFAKPRLEEVAFFFAEVNAACLRNILRKNSQIVWVFREIKHMPRDLLPLVIKV